MGSVINVSGIFRLVIFSGVESAIRHGTSIRTPAKNGNNPKLSSPHKDGEPASIKFSKWGLTKFPCYLLRVSYRLRSQSPCFSRSPRHPSAGITLNGRTATATGERTMIIVTEPQTVVYYKLPWCFPFFHSTRLIIKQREADSYCWMTAGQSSRSLLRHILA
ncbi:hypothetical protein J6590_073880 [Homalodisca vitripennis]|nr:hypothetical protein J6590_073880 [Homalodisca vitripennis]